MREIILSQDRVALVDDEDFPLVSQRVWYASVDNSTGVTYAATNVVSNDDTRTSMAMHRLLVGAGPNDLVDHKDHDGLNNQRHNLRVCTQRQNQQNQLPRPGASRYKGVSKTSSGRGNPWRAQIRTPFGRVHLGSFSTEEAAALAYDAAAFEHHREFAYLNFPKASGGHPLQA